MTYLDINLRIIRDGELAYASRRRRGVSAHILRLIAPLWRDGWPKPHPMHTAPSRTSGKPSPNTRVVLRNSIIVRFVSFDNAPTVTLKVLQYP
ncbi:unnamed protein product [Pieris macdunnoughi]|uniref:Uncharacterized protein n=1 Tax=Pieris macdunnoughi TaxID=345717 RepID=A0A821NSC2_9NEOP|nr:unnamed protein product [Pieris macdunnoughi]